MRQCFFVSNNKSIIVSLSGIINWRMFFFFSIMFLEIYLLGRLFSGNGKITRVNCTKSKNRISIFKCLIVLFFRGKLIELKFVSLNHFQWISSWIWFIFKKRECQLSWTKKIRELESNYNFKLIQFFFTFFRKMFLIVKNAFFFFF